MISKFIALGKAIVTQSARLSLFQMNNAKADGADGGFGAVLNFEFAEQSFEVSLHRDFAEKP